MAIIGKELGQWRPLSQINKGSFDGRSADLSKWDAIVRHHQSNVRTYALALTRDHHQAADLTLDVLRRAHLRPGPPHRRSGTGYSTKSRGSVLNPSSTANRGHAPPTKKYRVPWGVEVSYGVRSVLPVTGWQGRDNTCT